MRSLKGKNAVSEIIGTVLLLGIAIALFASFQVMVFSFPFQDRAPTANLVAAVSSGKILIEHHGGESLELVNTQIIFKSGNQPPIVFLPTKDNLATSTSNGDSSWDIGEIVEYTSIFPINSDVDVTVVDLKTNSVIMMGTVKGSV